jgi:fucose permease
MNTDHVAGKRFVRDRLTWEAYILLGYYGYLLNILGPITPFLKAKLNITYTLASFHFSAFAAGMILAGLGGDLALKRLGRKRAFWIGAVGMAGGVALLTFGEHPSVTVGAAFLMGSLGSLLLVLVPAILADHHGQHNTIAVSEANVIASFASAMAPMLVGFSARSFNEWRIPLFLSLAACALIGWLFRSQQIPDKTIHADTDASAQRRLSPSFWMFWLTLVLVVSVEFCMIFWGADYLEHEAGLARATAAAVLSVFLWAMMLSRWVGSRLVRSFSTTRLVMGTLVLSSISFVLYWGFSSPIVVVAGLFFSGLGIANLYPLILSHALGEAPENTNLASARAALASGTAILILPLVLGSLADRVGLRLAYGVVVALLLLSFGMFWAATRASTANRANSRTPGSPQRLSS